MNTSALLIASLTWGCVPKQAPTSSTDSSWRKQQPEPLAPRQFQLPEAQTATLKNGIMVSVVENHEMPLVNVRVAFDQGGWTDTDGQIGLASVTLDMLNEGAGDLDAAGISKATLPTMAGMVTSLSGIFFIAQIESKTRKAIANVEDELPLS